MRPLLQKKKILLLAGAVGIILLSVFIGRDVGFSGLSSSVSSTSSFVCSIETQRVHAPRYTARRETINDISVQKTSIQAKITQQTETVRQREAEIKAFNVAINQRKKIVQETKKYISKSCGSKKPAADCAQKKAYIVTLNKNIQDLQKSVKNKETEIKNITRSVTNARTSIATLEKQIAEIEKFAADYSKCQYMLNQSNASVTQGNNDNGGTSIEEYCPDGTIKVSGSDCPSDSGSIKTTCPDGTAVSGLEFCYHDSSTNSTCLSLDERYWDLIKQIRTKETEINKLDAWIAQDQARVDAGGANREQTLADIEQMKNEKAMLESEKESLQQDLDLIRGIMKENNCTYEAGIA